MQYSRCPQTMCVREAAYDILLMWHTDCLSLQGNPECFRDLGCSESNGDGPELSRPLGNMNSDSSLPHGFCIRQFFIITGKYWKLVLLKIKRVV